MDLYVQTLWSDAVPGELPEGELILSGFCFRFPHQLGIWPVETGLELKPSFSNHCQCALEQGSWSQACSIHTHIRVSVRV